MVRPDHSLPDFHITLLAPPLPHSNGRMASSADTSKLFRVIFQGTFGEIAPGIKILEILIGQWIYTFSRRPASVAHFVSEAELNPSSVVVCVRREAARP